ARRRVITARRERVVEAQGEAGENDLALGERDQRRMDAEALSALDARPGGQVRHGLECRDVLRPAVGVSAVVQGRDADENIAGAVVESIPPLNRAMAFGLGLVIFPKVMRPRTSVQ